MAIQVLSATHTGITVRSLPRAIHLFSNILGLPVERQGRLKPPVSTIVGRDDADISVALLALPGTTYQIELLQYNSPTSTSTSTSTTTPQHPPPWQPGSWHLCLMVRDIDASVAELEGASYDGESYGFRLMNGVREIEAGPRKGTRVGYVRDGEGLVVELMEGRGE